MEIIKRQIIKPDPREITLLEGSVSKNMINHN